VIADEDELAAGALDVVEQLRQLAGRDHAGLVDHQHALVGQPKVARPGKVGEQRGDACAGDAGAVLQLASGAPRRRDAQHREARRLPSLACGSECMRLARAGPAGDEGDAVATAAERLDHAALLRGQVRARGEHPVERRGRRAPCARVAQLERAVGQAALEREMLWRRVARTIGAGREQAAVSAPEGLGLAEAFRQGNCECGACSEGSFASRARRSQESRHPMRGPRRNAFPISQDRRLRISLSAEIDGRSGKAVMSERENARVAKTNLILEIEKGALDGAIPLADTLRKCVILGGKSGSEKLRDWAARELQGYKDADPPEYRKIPAPLKINGVNPGAMITGQQIGPHALPEVARGVIKEEVELRFGVGEPEALLHRDRDGFPERHGPSRQCHGHRQTLARERHHLSGVRREHRDQHCRCAARGEESVLDVEDDRCGDRRHRVNCICRDRMCDGSPLRVVAERLPGSPARRNWHGG
jgi:hypothetical protein